MKELCLDRQADQKIPRQSNIELLRIIAMLSIVAYHFSIHGTFEMDAGCITVNRLWIQFLQIGGKIGVDIFVLISGYFLISSKSLKTNKVIKLLTQILTYSISIFVIFIVSGVADFTVRGLIKSLFPITSSLWWFASTYFVLYLISPYVNRLLNAFNKKEYQRFLVLLTICWCVIPTFTTFSYESNSLLWFVYLYSLAGYIKLHSMESQSKRLSAICFLLATLFSMLTFLSVILFDVIGMKISFFAEHATYFYGMQKLTVLVISVLLFIGFLKMNIGYKRVINIAASATFGVYLIHDNAYVCNFLWHTLFKNASYSESNILIPYSLFVIAVVFVSCTIIELLRIYILERHYMGIVNSLADAIDKYKEKVFSLSLFDKF